MTTQNTPDERLGLPSASSFERRVFCPGSGTLEPAIPPEEEEREIASRGIDIHEALATDDDSELNLSDKRVAAKLRAIEEAALNEWRAQHNLTLGDITIHREVRLWIRDRSSLKPIASSKVDFAAVSEKHRKALVIDAKSGFLDTTPAELNWQLRVQAVSLHHEYNYDLDEITCAISQGRGKGKFDPVVYDTGDLMLAETGIRYYCHASKDQSAPRIPGDWCRYCRARAGQCREYAAYSMMPAVHSSSAISVRPGMMKRDIIAAVDQLPVEALGWIFSRKNAYDNMMDAVVVRLKGMLKDPLAELGLELKPNSPMRKISDIQLAYGILHGRGLCTDAEFRGMCKLSVGQIDELLTERLRDQMQAQTGQKVTLEDAGKELNRVLTKAIEMVEKSPSLKQIKPQK